MLSSYRQRSKLISTTLIWGSKFLLFVYIVEALILIIHGLFSTSASDFAGEYLKRLHKQKMCYTCITVLIKLVVMN